MKRRDALIAGALLVIVIAISLFLFFGYLATLPAWLLSARNSPEGVVVEVYQEDEAQPTYRTVLAGRVIPRDIDRARREELPPEVGTTIFFDQTVKPGRWTLMIDGTKLDIMERALIIDDKQELPPPRR